jgi:hypothetical protein
MPQHYISAPGLLDKVSRILGELDAGGLKFNIFNILGRSEYEDAHSNMLAALLNPNPDGEHSHGQGNVFLREFLSILKIHPEKFDPDEAKIEREVTIGKGKGRGRIDIVLTDKHKHQIFIENKIHAAEQDDQVSRYHAWNSDAEIRFLTIDGRKPVKTNPLDIRSLNRRLQSISYRDEISEWLEKCKESLCDNHAVREAIIQYHSIVKGIVKENIMMNEIIKVLRNQKAYRAYKYLLDNQKEIQGEIESRLKRQIETVAQKQEFVVKFTPVVPGKKRNSIVCKLTCPSFKQHNIGIFFDDFKENDGEYSYNVGFFTDRKRLNRKLSDNIIEKFEEKKWTNTDKNTLGHGVWCIIWKVDKAPVSDILSGAFGEKRITPRLKELVDLAQKAIASDRS